MFESHVRVGYGGVAPLQGESSMTKDALMLAVNSYTHSYEENGQKMKVEDQCMAITVG